jgi:DNA repair protein RecO (recombination protein O)
MARPAAKSHRVHDEAAFVLHRHDWSETSLILDVFSQHHGRVVLAAKGVKRPTSQFRAVLLPLQPVRLGWGGEAEVRTLKGAVWQGGHVMPTGEALLAGCYLNELLLKLLARDDPHPRLFVHYAQAVAALAQGAEHGVAQAAVLRAFEVLLLHGLGLLPALDEEGSNLAPLTPDAYYELAPDAGLRRLAQAPATAWSGAQWCALHRALAAESPFQALVPCCQEDRGGALRHQLRALLHYHSGVRVFQTRQLLLDLQRYGAAARGAS